MEAVQRGSGGVKKPARIASGSSGHASTTVVESGTLVPCRPIRGHRPGARLLRSQSSISGESADSVLVIDLTLHRGRRQVGQGGCRLAAPSGTAIRRVATPGINHESTASHRRDEHPTIGMNRGPGRIPGGVSVARIAARSSPRRSVSGSGGADHGHDAGPDRLGQVGPRIDHGGQPFGITLQETVGVPIITVFWTENVLP